MRVASGDPHPLRLFQDGRKLYARRGAKVQQYTKGNIRMPRFFTDRIEAQYTLTGEDAAHISKALRMRAGEKLTLCDGQGTDYLCEIQALSPQSVTVNVLEKRASLGEPPVRITLYQSLPKSDKMDWIVQKSVELGVYAIVPVQTNRCVSRPAAGAMEQKRRRWQKIAREAAMQSGRGIVPDVRPPMDFRQAVAQAAASDDLCLLCYEGGGESLRTATRPFSRCALFIGPEGGFDDEEVDLADRAAVRRITLGPRILRTETAPLAALTTLLFIADGWAK